MLSHTNTTRLGILSQSHESLCKWDLFDRATMKRLNGHLFI